MPAPIIPLLWIGGIVAAGWTAKQAGNAFQDASTPVKWAVIGGTVYVSYAALKSAGGDQVTIDIIITAFAVVNGIGFGGLWFRLGQLMESNGFVHTRLDGLTKRVRDIEIRQTTEKQT